MNPAGKKIFPLKMESSFSYYKKNHPFLCHLHNTASPPLYRKHANVLLELGKEAFASQKGLEELHHQASKQTAQAPEV